MYWTIFILIWITPMIALYITQRAAREEFKKTGNAILELKATTDDMRSLCYFVIGLILGWIVAVPIWISLWITRSTHKTPHTR